MRFGGLIAAVVFAAIAAVVVLRMSGGTSDTQQPVAPVAAARNANIYVATKSLPIGTTIAATDIGVQPWPENLLLDGFIQADGKTNLVGMVTRAPLQLNEPVTLGKVANPNDPNFLAGDLPKGMRVVTIPVNETDGVAGFVFPGDRVDLIYTHDVDKIETEGGSSSGGVIIPARTQKVKVTVTETLLTNVKVMAIDQRSSGAGAVDAKGSLIIPRSASLMVSAVDSQRVRLAQRTGTVSLVLRALADKESSDPLTMTSPSDVSQSRLSGGPVNALSGGGEANSGGEAKEDTIRILRGAPKTDKEMAPVSETPTTIMRGAATASTTPGATSIMAPPPPPQGGGNVANPGAAAF